MENDEPDGEYSGTVRFSFEDDYHSCNSAINSSILDYYKKFGRKRDLEQFFSLSTAQNELRDPASLFWRRIKAMSDSSDSGGKRSESPTELCRISIKCSMPDTEPYTPQVKKNDESVSPPIITEDLQEDDTKHSDDESVKSDDNTSQKSVDATLDTSVNKLLSPSSSITSQRKLEWDSLADVGYANENDCKNSATSLSTLERLALKQQYSNNDSENVNIGIPTAHSTPFDDDSKNKNKGKSSTKTTKIYRKDTELVQFNLPHTSNIKPAINFNLTKHISFNVDNDNGNISSKSVLVQSDPSSKTMDEISHIKMDKQIQTTLTKEQSNISVEMPKSVVPVLINLNALRRRQRRKKVHLKKSGTKIKKKEGNKENVPILEKSGEQVSDAESFEYMPGHIYNQKQMKEEESKTKIESGNKSSLESSGNFTTDSSKGSKHSFTKDLQKSLNLLKATLNKRYDDSNLKQKLIKDVVQRLLKSSYRDDESTTDFLSGLSFGSRKLGLSEATTTSTSEANTTEKHPKKSILRQEKFNSNIIASTSQSAPNLPSVSKSEKPVATSLKNLISSNTDSDMSSRGKTSDAGLAKTSSEELYQKYLEALKKEQAYKKHLKDKEMFLRQKLVCSDTAIKMPVQLDPKSQNKLKDLMKDLTRNNYDDGSGDASKLEGGSSTQQVPQYYGVRKQRSHSVFTLSSGEGQQPNRKNKKNVIKDSTKPGPSHDEHYCCCPYHTEHDKVVVGVIDSSVQVDFNNQLEDTKNLCECKRRTHPGVSHYVSDSTTGDIKYVCLCQENTEAENGSENILVYKCSRLTNKGFAIPAQVGKAWIAANETSRPSASKELEGNKHAKMPKLKTFYDSDLKKISQSSQTNLARLFNDKCNNKATPYGSIKACDDEIEYVHEATRQLQTEISINPRISDPSLCDIKIIANSDCAKLIAEQYRPVSKSSLEKASSENMAPEQFPMGSELSDGTSVTSENMYKRQQLRQMKTMTYTKNSAVDGQSASEHLGGTTEPADSMTIPIQGTNMTLVVNIAQNPQKQLIRNHDNQQPTNNQILADERQSLKGSQNSPRNINYLKPPDINTLFAKNKYDPREIETLSETSKNLEKGVGVQNDLLDDFFATESKKFDESKNKIPPPGSNTYPKASPKPFLRTNTDTNYLCHFQDSKMCQCGCLVSDCECDKLCQIESQEQPLLHRNISKNTFNDDYFFKPIKSVQPQHPEQIPASPKKGHLCPCSVPADCGNLCDTGDCYECNDAPLTHIKESLDKINPEPTRTPPPSKTWSKMTSCTKPIQAEPVGPNTVKQKMPLLAPVKVTPCKQADLSISKDKQRTSKMQKCPCADGAECGRFCDETAECWYPSMPETQSEIGGKGFNSKSPKKVVGQAFGHKSSLGESSQNRQISETLKFPSAGGAECGRRDETAEYRYPGMPHDDSQSLNKDAGKALRHRSSSDDEVEIARPDDNEDSSENDFEYLTNRNSEKERYMQTEPGDTKSIKLQKEPKSFSTKTDPATVKPTPSDQSSKSDKDFPELETPKDFIMQLINDVTKRYTKKDIQKNKRKKCFNEIMKILNYLLETEDPDPDILKAIENATSGATDSEQDIKNKISLRRNKMAEIRVFRCATTQEDPAASCSKLKSPIPAPSSNRPISPVPEPPKPEKTCADKCINVCPKTSKTYRGCCTESSDVPISSECACTSSDPPTCRMLDKIRKECEKYHQKRCKCKPHSTKCKNLKCEASSSTSVNCEKCKKTHHCHCRTHKCRSKSKVIPERIKKKCVAYNLIIQTSESMISEEQSFEQGRRLQNIIVKVPPKKKLQNLPFKEAEAKIGRHLSSPRNLGRYQRSRSWPNESGISSADDVPRVNVYSLKDYLERNRPDFMQQASYRQNCLRMINENRNQVPCHPQPSRLKMVVVQQQNGHHPCCGCNQPVTMYCEGVPTLECTCTDPYNMHMARKEVPRIAKDREIERELLSMQLQLQPDAPPMNAVSQSDLQHLARELGAHMRQGNENPKFTSEREMKKHSEEIYKSLPEVIRKKDELRKKRIRGTNLLMAKIFNKNLQKKTLRGSVNLSNYSKVFKI